jgi:hypothetical protein
MLKENEKAPQEGELVSASRIWSCSGLDVLIYSLFNSFTKILLRKKKKKKKKSVSEKSSERDRQI